jgi:hypothetical protein
MKKSFVLALILVSFTSMAQNKGVKKSVQPQQQKKLDSVPYFLVGKDSLRVHYFPDGTPYIVNAQGDTCQPIESGKFQLRLKRKGE